MSDDDKKLFSTYIDDKNQLINSIERFESVFLLDKEDIERINELIMLNIDPQQEDEKVNILFNNFECLSITYQLNEHFIHYKEEQVRSLKLYFVEYQKKQSENSIIDECGSIIEAEEKILNTIILCNQYLKQQDETLKQHEIANVLELKVEDRKEKKAIKNCCEKIFTQDQSLTNNFMQFYDRSLRAKYSQQHGALGNDTKFFYSEILKEYIEQKKMIMSCCEILTELRPQADLKDYISFIEELGIINHYETAYGGQGFGLWIKALRDDDNSRKIRICDLQQKMIDTINIECNQPNNASSSLKRPMRNEQDENHGPASKYAKNGSAEIDPLGINPASNMAVQDVVLASCTTPSTTVNHKRSDALSALAQKL